MPRHRGVAGTSGPSRRRRRLLLLAGFLAVTAALPLLLAAAAGGGQRHGLEVTGADISFTLQEEQVGTRYVDALGTQPLERILAEHGATYVRLRLWLAPPVGYSDQASALLLARRARRAGLKLLLDLHYSDFWADARSQTTPAAWRGQGLEQLAGTVRDYTRRVVADFARQGTPLDMVQVGNEVTDGLLWPLGQVYRHDGEHWREFTALLRAAVAGARDGQPAGRRLAVMLHIDRGGDATGARYFFDHVLHAGVDIDVLGLSYYPGPGSSLADLSGNLDALAARYRRPVLVAETAYPWNDETPIRPSEGGVDASTLPDRDRFPPTPTGQADFYTALRRVVQRVPHRRGLGFLVWEPGWLPGVEARPGTGDPYANTTLFTAGGHALPALRTAFQRR